MRRAPLVSNSRRAVALVVRFRRCWARARRTLSRSNATSTPTTNQKANTSFCESHGIRHHPMYDLSHPLSSSSLWLNSEDLRYLPLPLSIRHTSSRSSYLTQAKPLPLYLGSSYMSRTTQPLASPSLQMPDALQYTFARRWRRPRTSVVQRQSLACRPTICPDPRPTGQGTLLRSDAGQRARY